MKPVCLLPAAGASSRMRGGDKLMEPIDGNPCLAVMAERARAAGFDVLVSLPAADHPRAQALQGLQLDCFVVPDPNKGMSASLRLAAHMVLPSGSAMMVLPPDMPSIEINDLRDIHHAHAVSDKAIIQAATNDGKPGHPILFANPFLAEFAGLSGDRGAAALLKTHASDIIHVTLADDRARHDLDTPEDWAAWRASVLEV